METIQYDIYATLKFQSHYGRSLTFNVDERNKIYRSYWHFVNQLIFGKRNTHKLGLKIEAIQEFGEYGINPHLHTRIKNPNHLSISDTCILLNTIWKAKFYEKAQATKYNHITPIIDNKAVHSYNTKQHVVDLGITYSTNDSVIDAQASLRRINNYLSKPHIKAIHTKATDEYPLHVAEAHSNYKRRRSISV